MTYRDHGPETELHLDDNPKNIPVRQVLDRCLPFVQGDFSNFADIYEVRAERATLQAAIAFLLEDRETPGEPTP